MEVDVLYCIWIEDSGLIKEKLHPGTAVSLFKIKSTSFRVWRALTPQYADITPVAWDWAMSSGRAPTRDFIRRVYRRPEQPIAINGVTVTRRPRGRMGSYMRAFVRGEHC
jgi:hypothetical protein